jgi:hypothetical protein
MRPILLTLTLLSLTINSFSQQDSVLQQFTYSIPHYRAIGISLGTGTSHYDTDIPGGSNLQNGISASGGASYYYTQSTDKNLLTANSYFSLGYSAGKSSTPSIETKNKNATISSLLNINNKWFRNEQFLETGVEIAENNSLQKFISSVPYSNTKFTTNNFSLSATAGIGKGRLENVTDMQNALWLIHRLKREDRLSRTLSAAEMDALGHTITMANNTRVLDDRKKTEYILKHTDEFLRTNNLISQYDINYFTGLNDILFFAFNNIRLSGTEKFIRLTPAIRSYNLADSQMISVSKTTTRNTVRSVQFSAGLNKYKPQSLQHQDNYGISLVLLYTSYGLDNRSYRYGVNVGEQKSNPEIKRAGLNLFYEHAYYPDTRTIVSINCNAETGYQQIAQQKDMYGNIFISGNLNYFISYKTRLTCSAGGNYKKNEFDLNNDLSPIADYFDLFVNAGVTISL